MKIWVDDVRPAPEGYIWCLTVNEAKAVIQNITALQGITYNETVPVIELIDLDHDAGDFSMYGGDYIKILDWLEKQGWSFPIRLHTMNPVGLRNMRAIIQKNGWTEVM